MKQKLLKSGRQIRWLGSLSVFLFVLFSCTSELLQSEQEYSKNTTQNLIRQLRYAEFKNEAPNAFEKLKFKSLKNSKDTEHSKTFVINDFSIDAEYVYISEQDNGKKTYTFYLEKEERSSYLENYVLNEQDNGIFDAYMIRYDSIIVNHQSQIAKEDVANHVKLEYLGLLRDNSSVERALYCPKVPFQEYVYVPGICSSEIHQTGEAGCLCGTPGHMDCTPADEGFYIIQYVMLPTDCGGGGASPGGGVGPGSSPISTGPYNPGGGFGSVADPCDKIKNTNTKFTKLKPALVTISGTTSQNQENGFFIDAAATSSTTNPIQNFPVGAAGTIDISDNPLQKYVVIVHTHDANGITGNGTYSVFTWDDLAKINQLLIKNHIDVANFIFYVITADGTKYAMTIENPAVFQNFFYYQNPNNIGQTVDVERFKKIEKVFTKYYKKPSGLLSETSNPLNDKVNFLKFLKDTGLSSGVSLFESNSDFTSYSKITLKSNGIVNSQNCN